MKLISYNVNGIRAAIKKGLFEWIDSQNIDVVCLQEVKAMQEQVDLSEFKDAGYHVYWHAAEKKGYSGVAILTKPQPEKVCQGISIEKYDREGRILRADIGDITLLNCYFPSGTTGDVRQGYKYEFLDDFYNWVEELKKTRPNLIICGDYNIAHTENDIHNPVSNKKSSGFLPEERAWMTKWFSNGFKDSFRLIHPEKTEYSWWTYRANARANNKGWRIDYFSVSDPMANSVKKAGHYNDAVHSDHCPVFLEIK